MQISSFLTFAALLSVASAVPAPGGSPRPSVCPPSNFNAVSTFSLPAYLGQWYIQAQAPTQFLPESSNFCVSALYTQTSATEVSVFNYANRQRVNGEVQATRPNLKATITNPAEPSKLSVGPQFLPAFLGGPYWVVATGPINAQTNQYEWALVSGGLPNEVGNNNLCWANASGLFNINGSGQGLWIFTRAQVADAQLVAEIRRTAVSLGLDESKMLPVVQEGCLYQG
ncbi:hypothetical protein HDV05_008145 [Chytridiales sp. JEL 0842]|nr:hypothetical protein HDV05_008145 [Chytridiales sp. JEL 0842]